MKIALAQLNYHIGNFEKNVAAILAAIKKGKDQKADLVVFAELALCGYPPRDFLNYPEFIGRCQKAIEEIAAECKGVAALVGAPSVNPNPKGKRLLNSAFFIAEGKVQKIISKTLLPTYDVFDEYRYFEPNNKFEVIQHQGVNLAVTICEDIWNLGDRPMYTISPMDKLMAQEPDAIINIAASPFSYAHLEERKKVAMENAKKYKLPVFYLNHVGAQTELIFDGGSMVINPHGELYDELLPFEEDFKIYKLGMIADPDAPTPGKNPTKIIPPKIQRIHDALVMGIREYFTKMNFQKAVIGLSGGVDSAVVLLLAKKALGKENVKAILMPSQFSTDHSVKDAEELAKSTGIPYEIIPIEKLYTSFMTSLKGIFGNSPFGLAEENLQARIRGTLLMAISNKFGHILLNTTNKSEMAVGYGTLYGDMAGGLAVLGDVYKTDVYEIAAYLNKTKKIIPANIISKAPSAELRPDQKDADSLPDYSVLDKILYQYIELSKGAEEIIKMDMPADVVKKTIRMVDYSEYKRYQFAPILRVSGKAFGMGRRMPIVAKYST